MKERSFLLTNLVSLDVPMAAGPDLAVETAKFIANRPLMQGGVDWAEKGG
jgi:hypothetical protein